MSAKVVLHYNAGPRLQAQLDAVAEATDGALTATWSPEGDPDALRVALADATVLLHVLEPVTSEVLGWGPQLQLVQKLGVGVNTIDLDAARARGIAVANLPGSNAIAVAEHTIGLILATLRRLPAFDAEVRAGRGWPLHPSIPERLGEIADRTVGLVGHGPIAKRVGMIATAMGAHVVHHCRTPDGDGWLPLDELLERSDVVSIHLPLTDATRGLIGADRIARMRRGALLVNTGRGGIVDEPALVAALRDGRLAGAGLDVFADEPLPAGSALTALDNVVLTPHVAWLTMDTLARAVGLGIANARRIVAGDEPEHRVV